MKRVLGRMAAGLGKVCLKLIACLLGAALLTGCFTGALLLADVAKERGGSRYDALGDRLEALARRVEMRMRGGLSEAEKTAYLVEGARALADAQAQTEGLLLAELESGAYTLDSPFVLVNPYGNSPLTAIALFQTEAPAQISIEIPGDTPLAAVQYDFEGYDTAHQIPIYGLYAGRTNTVILTATERSGARRRVELEVQTDALPDALSHETVRARLLDAEGYAPGFTFTHQGNHSKTCKAALDVNGAYRWYLDTSGPGALNAYIGYFGSYNGGESVLISCGSLHYGPVLILELNFLGKLLNAWYAPYGAHHDIAPDGDTLLVCGSPSADVRESMIYEIDRDSGEIVTALDYGDVLQVNRNQCRNVEGKNFYSREDWCHINTVVPCGEDVIISARHQSTVARTGRDGQIRWMLCDPEGYYAYYRQFILRPVGEDFEYPYIQHAPEILPDQDGDPDTMDILLFDNGDFRGDAREFASRMVQYRIDEREMTVEQIWSYGGERNEIYSYRHGDADLLENGNRLGSFEPYDPSAEARCAYGVEVAEDGSVVWECWRLGDGGDNDYSEYRLERLEIYAASANDLHLGERPGLHLPEGNGGD